MYERFRNPDEVGEHTLCFFCMLCGILKHAHIKALTCDVYKEFLPFFAMKLGSKTHIHLFHIVA